MIKLLKWFQGNTKAALWIAACICFVVIAIGLRFFWGDAFYPAEISNAYLCQVKNSLPVKIDYLAVGNKEEVYICAHVETDGRPATLGVYVWGPGNKTQPDSGVHFRIEPGNAMLPVDIPVYTVGGYHIKVTDKKKIVAELFMVITENE